MFKKKTEHVSKIMSSTPPYSRNCHQNLLSNNLGYVGNLNLVTLRRRLSNINRKGIQYYEQHFPRSFPRTQLKPVDLACFTDHLPQKINSWSKQHSTYWAQPTWWVIHPHPFQGSIICHGHMHSQFPSTPNCLLNHSDLQSGNQAIEICAQLSNTAIPI